MIYSILLKNGLRFEMGEEITNEDENEKRKEANASKEGWSLF